MKQYKRGLIVLYLFLALAVIVCTSCRTRKVATDINKSSDKSKTEQSSKVKEDTKIKIEDKSTTKVTETDSGKTVINEETEITADEVIKDSNGSMIFSGNVKVKGKKSTDISNNKKNVLESLKNVNTDIAKSKDSTGKKKQELDKKSVLKKKATSVESSFGWAFAVAGILLLLAFLAVKWNWLRGKFV